MLNVEGRTAFTSEHEIFRASVSKFLEREFLPHFDRWEANGIIDRSFWRACGDAGLLCPTVPEEYGGLGWISASTRSSTKRSATRRAPFPVRRSSRTSWWTTLSNTAPRLRSELTCRE